MLSDSSIKNSIKTHRFSKPAERFYRILPADALSVLSYVHTENA